MTFASIPTLSHGLACAAAGVASCGVVIVMAGVVAVRRFARAGVAVPRLRPPVTVMKPLCGDEPHIESALRSILAQDYPVFQVVFGVQDPDDPALIAVARLRAQFPHRDISVVTDPALHGPNRKVGNLINMLPHARHDILVFSDSDLHVAPDYLDRIVAALDPPGVGLVTAMCTGLPTSPGWPAQVGASALSYTFLPGVLISRALGREDCLGTSMALRRETLARAGGLEALVRHLADDNVLAQRVRRLGLHVALAATVPRAAVPEASWAAIWNHELRWARTIRSLEPILYAPSAVQFPIFWAILAMLLSGGAAWSVAILVVAWVARAVAARQIDRIFGGGVRGAAWLLPLRDVLSACEVAASYAGGRVVWRGHTMRIDDTPRFDTVRRVSRPV